MPNNGIEGNNDPSILPALCQTWSFIIIRKQLSDGLGLEGSSIGIKYFH